MFALFALFALFYFVLLAVYFAWLSLASLLEVQYFHFWCYAFLLFCFDLIYLALLCFVLFCFCCCFVMFLFMFLCFVLFFCFLFLFCFVLLGLLCLLFFACWLPCLTSAKAFLDFLAFLNNAYACADSHVDINTRRVSCLDPVPCAPHQHRAEFLWWYMRKKPTHAFLLLPSPSNCLT